MRAPVQSEISVELQQRACEFGQVLTSAGGALRAPLVKRMPVPDLSNPLTRNTEEDDDEEEADEARLPARRALLS